MLFRRLYSIDRWWSCKPDAFDVLELRLRSDVSLLPKLAENLYWRLLIRTTTPGHWQ